MLLTTVAEERPMPKLEPPDRFTPPARTASLLLSVASTATSPQDRVLFPATSTVDSAPETSTLTAPAMDTLEFLPETEPLRAWAASFPA